MDKIILFCIWALLFAFTYKKIKSGRVYFFFLACMILPVSIGRAPSIDSWYHDVDALNMLALALCLVFGFFPWLIFDRWSINRIFIVPDKSIPTLKIIFTLLIIGSLYSILYLAPFAIKSLSLGANEVRVALRAGKDSMLPNSIFTTVAVSVAGLNVYAILFFFIACLTPKLKQYRILLIISSCSYLVSCFAITARDGLIVVPCFYIVYYLIFQDSFPSYVKSKIQRRIRLMVLLAAVFMTAFSVSRFYGSKKDINDLYIGTVGYVSQQPYVFDETIKKQDDFWGFECRFPLVNRIIGVGEHEVDRSDSFEWSFGTMYAEFYDAFAWKGLIGFTIFFMLYYALSLKFLILQRNTFGMLLMFTVYLFIAITGMFYTRAGSSVNMNIFYFALSIIPFFPLKYIQSRKQV